MILAGLFTRYSASSIAPGSKVTKVSGTESLVSKVFRDLVISFDLLCALSGGSITGAPKRRAVELLSDLSLSHGALHRSIGVVWPDGRVSASILIRTLVNDNEGWSLNVGGNRDRQRR